MKKCVFLLLVFPSIIEITPADPPKPAIANLVIHNARVLTVDAKFTIAQAIAVQNDRILEVGSNHAVLGCKSRPATIVLAGSNQSGSGGDEAARAFGEQGRFWRLRESVGRNVSKR